MDMFSLISHTQVLGKWIDLLKGHFIYEMVVVFFHWNYGHFIYYFLFNIVM